MNDYQIIYDAIKDRNNPNFIGVEDLQKQEVCLIGVSGNKYYFCPTTKYRQNGDLFTFNCIEIPSDALDEPGYIVDGEPLEITFDIKDISMIAYLYANITKNFIGMIAYSDKTNMIYFHTKDKEPYSNIIYKDKIYYVFAG